MDNDSLLWEHNSLPNIIIILITIGLIYVMKNPKHDGTHSYQNCLCTGWEAEENVVIFLPNI